MVEKGACRFDCEDFCQYCSCANSGVRTAFPLSHLCNPVRASGWAIPGFAVLRSGYGSNTLNVKPRFSVSSLTRSPTRLVHILCTLSMCLRQEAECNNFRPLGSCFPLSRLTPKWPPAQYPSQMSHQIPA